MFLKKLSFFIAFCTWGANLMAQNAYLDSLKQWNKVHQTSNYDSLRILNLNQLSQRLSVINTIDAWKYAYELDRLAQSSRIKMGHALSKMNFGTLELLDGNYVISQDYYLTALKIAEENKWYEAISKCYNLLGIGYKEMHQYEKSTDFLQKAVNLNIQFKNNIGLAKDYAELGDIYFLQNLSTMSLAYYYKGFNLVSKKDDQYQTFAKILTGIGKVYNSQKKYKLSDSYFKSAEKILLKHQDRPQLVENYIEYAKLFRNQGDFKKSIDLINKGSNLVNNMEFIKAKSSLEKELSFTYELMGEYKKAYDHLGINKALDDQIAKRRIATRNEVLTLKERSFVNERENVALKKIKVAQENEIETKAFWIGALIGVLLLLALLASYIINRNRINSLQKIHDAQTETIRQMKISEQIRVQLARDLHDDMGSTLSSISILSQVAEKEAINENGQTARLLGKINQNSQRMLDTMNDIVWTTQPVNDTVESISVKIREFAAEMFDAKDIKYQIDIDEHLLHTKLPANQVYNFYLIIKEAINNIAKYAQATQVAVVIKKLNSGIFLKITDNGVGFDVEKVRAGSNGLKNMDRRALDLGGELKITATPNAGTQLELKLPFS